MRTQWGRSAAFTMRSFRFTSTGTTGDNNDQPQRISCDVKMIPADTPIGLLGPDCVELWDTFNCKIYEAERFVRYAQMPDCDCYTPDQCEANRNEFSARAYCEKDESYAVRNQLPGHIDKSVLCDDWLNMCHVTHYNEDDMLRGVCENCLTLKTAKDCQERDQILIFIRSNLMLT